MHILPTHKHDSSNSSTSAPQQGTSAAEQEQSPASPALHQKLGNAADRFDGSVRVSLRRALVGDKLRHHPKTVLAVAATGFTTSYANSAGRHAAQLLCTLVCAQGLYRLGHGLERGVSYVGDKLGTLGRSPNQAQPTPATDPAAHRHVLDRLERTLFPAAPRLQPAPKTMGQKVGYAVASPLYVLNEVLALGLTTGAIMVGVGTGLVGMFSMAFVSALLVVAVAYEKPDMFVWLAANGLRTAFKVVDEFGRVRDYLQSKQDPQASGKKRLLSAVVEPAPSVDEALGDLLGSMQHHGGDVEAAPAVERNLDQLATAVANLPALAGLLGVTLSAGPEADAVVSRHPHLQRTPAELFSTAILIEDAGPVASPTAAQPEAQPPA